MAQTSAIRKNHYQDSMKLMQISRKLGALSGVLKASAVMATEANLKMLAAAGLIQDTIASANANDMIVTVEAESEQAAKDALEMLDVLLAPPESAVGAASKIEYPDFRSALKALPGANIAVVSTPGAYAKIEVAKAIESGIHTFLFSDNMTVEEEIELKERASARGLFVMGPGCGTAIVGGVGLGFANVVRRGPVGIIAAAGTGLQEVSSLIHNLGSGITHAIGVGGRDMSERVGGIMTLQAIGALQRDEATKVIVLVSKPPSERIAEKVVEAIAEGGKPAVVCFLGMDFKSENPKIRFAPTLDGAVLKTLEFMGFQPKFETPKGLGARTLEIRASLGSRQSCLRGLFSGGTLCYEAQRVLAPILGSVYSNAPLDKEMKLEDSRKSKRHSCVDMGEEEFTQGRPHPMIDASLRAERIVKEASDPSVAVILLDVVLGYVAASDPAGDLLPAIREARNIARRRKRSIAFVAHICGTDQDPQGFKFQSEKLEGEGVIVCPTNAMAARVAGEIATRGKNT